MSRIRRLDADRQDRSSRADVLLREEPDEEDDEDDEDDEGNVTDDEGDDEEDVLGCGMGRIQLGLRSQAKKGPIASFIPRHGDADLSQDSQRVVFGSCPLFRPAR